MAAHSAGNRTIPPVAIDQSAVGWPQWLREMAQSINLVSSWVGTATTPGATQADADLRYVNVAGDTMSGALLLRQGVFPAGVRTALEVSAATPAFTISDNSAATDSKTWDMTAAGTALSFRAITDTYGAANTYMTVIRSGATIAYTQFPQGGVLVGNPTGGNLGTGTLNAIAVYAMGSLLTSDAALKTDIEPLATACLPLVMAVEPKTYRWREPEEAAEGRRSGFLAQDLAGAEVPGIVVGKPGESMAVDIGAILATLWQAVRELTGEVAVLKAAAEKP